MYRVWCRFEPALNPLTARHGRWRVVDSYSLVRPMNRINSLVFGCVYELCIISSRYHQKGSFIRPHKELNKVLLQRKTARIKKA